MKFETHIFREIGSDISVSPVSTPELSTVDSSSASENDDEDLACLPSFTRPFTKPVGGTFTLEKEENELDFFFQFFDDNLFEKIVDETNSYAEKCQQTNPNPKWKKVGVPEMKAFFGIYIVFSIVRYQHTL